MQKHGYNGGKYEYFTYPLPPVVDALRHTDLGPTRFAQLRTLVRLVRNGTVTLGGNRSGKIYGRLNCWAGKRMKPANWIFFRDAAEAIEWGFRPCAFCMPEAYRDWRANC